MTEDRRRRRNRGLITEPDTNNGLSAGKQFGGIDAFFEVLMHPCHRAGVTGVEPAEEPIYIIKVQRGRVGDSDEVETEVKGFLLYLFSKAHFLSRRTGCRYIIPSFNTK